MRNKLDLHAVYVVINALKKWVMKNIKSFFQTFREIGNDDYQTKYLCNRICLLNIKRCSEKGADSRRYNYFN